MRIEHSRAAGRPAALDLSGVKIFIALPTRGTCSLKFASSMALSVTFLTAAGADVSILEGRNGFVDFNRNNLIARFMQTDCTHIWFVDDDMGWDPQAIVHMLKKDKEFIAGAGPLKQDEPLFAIKHATNPDETPVVVDGLIPCSHIGGAFMLLKRSVIEKMILGFPGLKCAAVDGQYGYSLFQCLYETMAWRGEDYVFCERWTSLGGEIWCYPNITFSHTGIKEWSGNYHLHLVAQPAPGEEAPLQPTIAGQPIKPITDESRTKALIEKQVDPTQRKNGFLTAIEKIILCESYINRVAKEVIRLQGEHAKA